jgi:hypothetical protein
MPASRVISTDWRSLADLAWSITALLTNQRMTLTEPGTGIAFIYLVLSGTHPKVKAKRDSEGLEAAHHSSPQRMLTLNIWNMICPGTPAFTVVYTIYH